MAVNRTPVLKRCRSLGLDPDYFGYDKKSKRELKRAKRTVKKKKKKKKQNSSTVY